MAPNKQIPAFLEILSPPGPNLSSVGARGMSQGLQALTKHSFLSRRPDQGDDGLSRNCNVEILIHMVTGHPVFYLTRWWDRENGRILMDLGDQNSAELPAAP